MKSYTDLEQSKKLSEILPIESADMYYFTIIRDYPYSQGKIKTIIKIMDGSFSSDCDTPCWSLTALINVLPDKICLNNETYHLNYDKNEVKYLGYITWDGQKCITSKANNIIDSCYEMIIKLYEQKLL